MKFCRECGFRLDGKAAPAQPAGQPPASPVVCWRCLGAGDGAAEFCKFCGARHKDAPSAGAASASVGGRVLEPAPLLSPAAAPTGFATPVAIPPGTLPVGSSPSTPRIATPETFGRLVGILKDGSDGKAYTLSGEHSDLGRTEGDVRLPDDPYLSLRHARISHRQGAFAIRDLESINGVFLRLRDPAPLQHGDTILVGQQVLRFELLADGETPLGPAMQHGVMLFGTPEVPRSARLVQCSTDGVARDVYHLYRDETILGRETGDIVFTDDPFLSRKHAAIAFDRAARRFTLRDLGSSNGTALRIRGEHALVNGDQLRIGRHLFRFEGLLPAGRGAR